jgi:predicted DNA-binding protein
MSRHDDAAQALESRDWSGAQVEERPRTGSVVQSVRFSRDLTERLMTEAERRGTTPSEVIRDLVEAGLAAAEQSATVRLVDVQRAINALVHRAA